MCKDNMCCERCCLEGPAGPAGMQGPQGEQGVPGMQGIPGQTGAQGPRGLQGEKGDVGPQGLKGDKGDKGDAGEQGATGLAGPAGPMGEKGEKGDTGLKGDKGDTGEQGPVGATGPAGPAGEKGDTGEKGEKGDPGENLLGRAHLTLYSNVDQNMDANGGAADYVKFEANQSNSGDFDLSMANVDGSIRFLKTGTYFLSYTVDGGLLPPFPSPVPSWALAFYKNNVLVTASGQAGFSQSPDDDAICLSVELLLDMAANDVLKLRNMTMFPIFLKAVHPELVAPVASAVVTAVQIM